MLKMKRIARSAKRMNSSKLLLIICVNKIDQKKKENRGLIFKCSSFADASQPINASRKNGVAISSTIARMRPTNKTATIPMQTNRRPFS